MAVLSFAMVNEKRIQDFGQFQPFLALWDPLVEPLGVFILIFHSLLLSPHQISVTMITIVYQSEMDGGKIQNFQDFGQFWLFLVLWGANGVSQGPPSPYFGGLPYSRLKYLQNETNPRLLAQSIKEPLRKQGELSNHEGLPPFLGRGGGLLANNELVRMK